MQMKSLLKDFFYHLLKTLVGLIGLAVVVYMAWNAAYPSGTWRYKMTVTVETPEGIKTGSAVREVHARRQPKLLPDAHGASVKVKGEAVVVDLGPRGVLFALMRGDKWGGDYGKMIVFDAFPTSAGGLSEEGIRYYSALKDAKTTLPPESYPMFVRFDDLNSPATVKNVYETERCLEKNGDGTCIKRGFRIKADRFEEMFGRGIALKEVTIEMTDEPVTIGVQRFLSWLPKYYNKRLDGDRFGYSEAEHPLANSLSSGTFSTEALSHGR